MFAGYGRAHVRHFLAAIRHAKLGGGVLPLNVSRAPIAIRAQAKSLHRAKRFRGDFLQFRGIPEHQDLPAPGDQVYQPPELQRDRGQVRINIGVVEFQRGQNQFVGVVVQKLRPAIEERSLILVAFDDEFFAAAQAVAAFAEIRRHAANQKIRAPPGDMKNPREHGRGRGLAVGSGHHDRSVPRNEIFFEQLRHRAVRQFFVENIFDLRISARDDIPHHTQVRRGLQIFFAEAFVPGNFQRIEQGRGRRIHIHVGAGHVKPAFL